MPQDLIVIATRQAKLSILSVEYPNCHTGVLKRNHWTADYVVFAGWAMPQRTFGGFKSGVSPRS
jgi:hypothetical protein